MNTSQLNELSSKVINACFEVHKHMGPGLLETIYEQCLMREFFLCGIKAKNQVEVPLFYKGSSLNNPLRIDILVENEIIIELKSVEKMYPVFEAQIISYLKLMNKKLGFLVNFNSAIFKNGVKRFVNKI